MAFLEYKPNTTIYQYCSKDGFSGILESKNLWFTDLRSANDPREIRLGYEKFIHALSLIRANEYKGWGGRHLSRFAMQLAGMHERMRFFCCCFTKRPDELPMWGAYGGSYTGLAIGFRPTAVTDMHGRVQQVRYIDENTDSEFKRLALEVAEALVHLDEREALKLVSSTVEVLSAISSLKHSTWSYEKEVRIVYAQTSAPPAPFGDRSLKVTSFYPDEEEYSWTEPSIRVRDSEKVEYIAFPFGRYRSGRFDPSRAIEKVIIGPKCNFSIHEVATRLEAHGFRDYVVENWTCAIR